jgi:hypothetical protein
MVSSEHTNGASSSEAVPGVLWVTVTMQEHERRITTKHLENWYAEHIDIVLDCPGNGGLFLRYLQTDPSISEYSNPDFAGRMSDPEGTKDAVAKTGWKYLALVKLSDVTWLSSPQFDAMPRTSKFLPPELDGSVGSGFSYMNAALRGYVTIAKGSGKSKEQGRAKWLLSLQIESADPDALEGIGKKYEAVEGVRGWIAYGLRDGVLGYCEPGHMPRGLLLIEMDKRVEVGQEEGVVRRDVWELTAEKGDLSLGL